MIGHHPLNDCRLKLQRADEHIREFHNDIMRGKIRIPANTVRAQSQFQARWLNDPTTYQRQIIFTLRGDAPPVDARFSILAGEAIHHLRSVLDHLVYRLVIAKTNHPPTFNSAFPIVGRGRMVKNVWRSAADEYAAQTSRLKQDIAASAEARINTLQPYHRGTTYNQDLLWQLSELDNAYKHRLLLLTVCAVSHYVVTVSSGGRSIKATFSPNVKFENGAHLGTLPITDPSFSIANTDVSMDGDTIVAIAFDEIAEQRNVSVLDRLAAIRNLVAEIIDSFVPEFV